MNLTVFSLSVPSGNVTIRESAWKISFVVDLRVIGLCFAEVMSMDVISVLNLMRF